MKGNTKVLLLAAIVVSAFVLGCIGIQRSELSLEMPEEEEVALGSQKVLNLSILSREADAVDVFVNVTMPPEVSETVFASKNFESLPKNETTNLSFSYTPKAAGSYRILVEVNASNANATNRSFDLEVYISLPVLEIGEFWVYNQTKADEPGLHVSEVIRKEFWEKKEHYVIKEVWEGEPNGTYKLTYIGVSDLSASKIEYYEDGSLVRESTVEMNPPITDYAFPLKIGKKWSWRGIIFGFGNGEISSELTKKENVTLPAGTYVGYYIKQKMNFPSSTNDVELWYVPELKGPAKVSMSVQVFETSQEVAMELLDYGEPPAKPQQIQVDVNVPAGYETYWNDLARFRIAHPSNWWLSSTTVQDFHLDRFSDGVGMVSVSVEPIKLRDLEEYKELKLESLRTRFPWIKISELEPIEVNKRKGYKWILDDPVSGAKGKIAIFVVGGYGFTVFLDSSATNFKLYEQVYEKILSTFFIKGRTKPRYG